MEDEVKTLFKTLKEMKCDKKCNAYIGITEEIKRWLVFLPLIAELRDDAMRERHWKAIKDKVQKDFHVDDKLLLRDVYNLNLNKYQEDVEEITDQARQEAKMEKTLVKLEETWKDVVFEFNKHKDTDIMLIKLSEENFEMLEENQVAVTAMFSSRYLSTFEEKCVYWQKSLAAIAEIIQLLAEVQRSWSFLENLFIHSEEVKKELPRESERFVDIDKEVK
jgi:dynein heavy chain